MKILFRLGALGVGLLAAVLAAEVALRFMGMGFGNSPMEPDPVLHHVHPKNYTFVQQHPSGELGGFPIYYNSEGRVVRGPGAAATPGNTANCRIALMGDSFTEAGQVPFAESFAGLLEGATQRCEVRNYGVRSYSPAIYLVQWTELIRPWRPTHVFVLLFGGDVREDVSYLTTATVDDKGLPTAIHGPSDGWLASQLRRFYVARFARMVLQRMAWAREHAGEPQWTVGGVVEENPEWGGPTPLIVAELNRRVAAEGGRLSVMAVPSRYRLMGDGSIPIPRDFHETVKQWAAQSGIDFLDLNQPFERAAAAGVPLFFLQDIHFTAEGNALVASAISRTHPDLFDASQTITSRSVRAAFPASTP